MVFSYRCGGVDGHATDCSRPAKAVVLTSQVRSRKSEPVSSPARSAYSSSSSSSPSSSCPKAMSQGAAEVSLSSSSSMR